MDFEVIAVRPVSGTVDVAAVARWLDAQPFVFKDPIEDQTWHLSATRGEMKMHREQRIADPGRFPLGLVVTVSPQVVGLGGPVDSGVLARAYQFLAWLAGDREWTVMIDWGPVEPLGDPRRLFPAVLPDLVTLDDAGLVDSLADGSRVRWDDQRVTDARVVLIVHSSGRWRLARGVLAKGPRVMAGRLTPAALDAWLHAIAEVDTQDPALAFAHRNPNLTVEFPEDSEPDYLEIDPAAPPPHCEALVAMVTRWLAALDAWTPPTVLDELGPVGVG